jgi:DNA polymerase-3 subunit delta
MQAQQFFDSLHKNNHAPPLLFLLGEEALLHEKIIHAVAEKHLGAENAADIEHIDAQTTKVAAILDAAASGGLFASERVLAIHSAEALGAATGSHAFDMLKKNLSDPDPSVVMIFSAPTVHKGKNPFKMMLKLCEVVECDRLKGDAMKRWVRDYVTTRGYRFDGNAEELALDLLGNDMLLVRNSLDKVMLYIGERRSIEYGDIEKNFQSMREHAIWELTAAIGNRKDREAIEVLARLLGEGKHPLQIIASLQFQFRQLLVVKSMLIQKKSPQEIARQAGLRFFVERTIAQARGYSGQELLTAYRGLYYMENSMKSAGADPRFILEKYIIETCHATTAARG